MAGSQNTIDVLIRATSENVAQTSEQIKNLGDNVSGLVDKFAGIGEALGAAFAIDKLEDFAQKMSELGESIERTSKMTGLSTDDVQKFQFAVQMTGGDADTAGQSLIRLERNIALAAAGSKTAQANFAAAGVSMQAITSGNVNEVLGEIADKFHDTADGAGKLGVALSLGGRGAANLIPILDQGRAGLEAFNEELSKTNSQLTQAQVEGFAGTAEKMRLMEDASKGISVQIETRLNPGIAGAVTGLTLMKEEFSASIENGGVMSHILDGLSDALIAIVATIDAFVTGLKQVWDIVSNLDAVLVGLIDLLGTVGLVMGDLIARNFTKAWADMKGGASEAFDEISKGFRAASADGEAFIKRLKEMQEARDKAVIPSGGKQSAGNKKPQIQVADQSGAEQEKTDYATQRSLIQENYNVKKEADDLSVESGNQSRKEELSDLQRYLDVSHDLITQSFNDEMNQYTKDSAAYQKLKDQMLVADQKYKIQHDKLTQEMTKEDNKQWTDAFNIIERSFEQMTTGILRGNQTIQQAFLRLADNLIVSMANAGIKIALDWVKNQLIQVAGTTAAEQEKVAAKAAGTAESKAIDDTAHSSEIMKDASSAAAGAYSALAGIPIIGPIIAPVAAGVAFAAVAAYDSFDVGTPYVPHDMLAQIHQGEAIIPAGKAQQYRDGDLGLGGRSQVHLHVHALDSSDVKRYLGKNSKAIAGALSKQVRGGDRSFLSHA